MNASGVRRLPPVKSAALAVGGIGLSLAVGKMLPSQVESLPTSQLVLVPAALAALVGVAWLSIYRQHAALLLAFALLGVVRKEPAPVDLVFALLIAATYAVGRPRPRVPTFVGLPLAVFCLVSMLSMVNATDTHRAVKFETITLYMIALGVWLAWAFSIPHWVRTAAKTYLAAAIVSGAMGPLALYTPLPGRSLFLYGGARAEGFFKDPNVYSAFLVPAGIILLEEFSSPRILRWRRRSIMVAFGVVALGLLVAYSRAAWLDFALGISVLVIVQAARRGGFNRAFRSVGVLVVFGLVGFGVLYATGSITFLQQRSHLESYDTQRFANQDSAFTDMTRHVFGYGPGQSEAVLPLSTHSTFARAAFEQGLLGIAALVAVLGATLACAFALARRRIDVHGVGTAALLAIWIGQVANGYFIDTLHWRHLWIFAALIWCGYMEVERRNVTEGTVERTDATLHVQESVPPPTNVRRIQRYRR